ncbi:blast:Probable RNA-directed DNA polymerase from transposon BS [Mytilus galloprovincialis]|uniref:Blast:Probable RNA-directed DNA polymerase from transposon BS n=1 Tax=Mytilus galloprovincialis TaxID=29158 RepID=A0A8B6EIM9_MYTGA|nr:blast:Probable RNA-directed DNA polymerase from transposon BS [Mytilus galloprovincialis]
MIFEIDIKEPDQQCFNKQPKKLYSYIKSQRNENTGIAPLRSECTLHTNPSEKANILNKQFQSAFTSEKNIEIPTKEPSSHPIMEKINISREGVYKLIKNINTNKATGPDTIAGKILKENIEITSYILTIIFNKSLETGKVPSDWNHANVTPVFKKGDKHHPGNYRPISLTCISCKLLEHILASNMMKHLETNKILYELQHGFRSKRSCESQVISLVHQLAQNNDKNIQTDLVIMDFAKAFDKVPHKRLLYKLKHYGISDQAIHWIDSFLSNRTQTVLLENTTSNIIPVTSGVPQGTVLGPILFLIYINDLPDYLKHSQIRLFADDSIIYRPITCQNDCIKLQEDIEAAIKWEKDWLMSFHPDKCNILRVSTKKKNKYIFITTCMVIS